MVYLSFLCKQLMSFLSFLHQCVFISNHSFLLVYFYPLSITAIFLPISFIDFTACILSILCNTFMHDTSVCNNSHPLSLLFSSFPVFCQTLSNTVILILQHACIMVPNIKTSVHNRPLPYLTVFLF